MEAEEVRQLWSNNEDLSSKDELEDQAIFNPAVVKGKGRPKGSKNKVKGASITGEYYCIYFTITNFYSILGTRRDPSAFELPPSTAPAALPAQELPMPTTNITIFRNGRTEHTQLSLRPTPSGEAMLTS